MSLACATAVCLADASAAVQVRHSSLHTCPIAQQRHMMHTHQKYYKAKHMFILDLISRINTLSRGLRYLNVCDLLHSKRQNVCKTCSWCPLASWPCHKTKVSMHTIISAKLSLTVPQRLMAQCCVPCRLCLVVLHVAGGFWIWAQAVGAESLFAHECWAAIPSCCSPHASSNAVLTPQKQHSCLNNGINHVHQIFGCQVCEVLCQIASFRMWCNLIASRSTCCCRVHCLSWHMCSPV